MTTFYFFIQSLPESTGLFALSLALAKVPLRWGRIFAGGLIISIISYIIRALPVTFGLHMPVMIFVLFIMIIKLTRVTPSRAVLAIFSSFFVLALLEYLVSSVFFAVSNIDPNKAMANEALWAYIGVIQSTILILIAVFVSHYFRPVRELWKK